jgi:hypothetical protein
VETVREAARQEVEMTKKRVRKVKEKLTEMEKRLVVVRR